MNNALSATLIVLQGLKAASSAVPAAPYLGMVAEAGISLVKTIQKVRDDKDRAVRVGKRVESLVKHIFDSVNADTTAVNDALTSKVDALVSTLKQIQEDIEKLLQKNVFKRFVKQGSVAKKLDDAVDRLDDARQLFNTTSLISIQKSHIRLEEAVSNSNTHLARIFDHQQLAIVREGGHKSIEPEHVSKETAVATSIVLTMAVHAKVDVVPLLRAFSLYLENHFFTTDAKEMDKAVNRLGYTPEGYACFAFSTQAPSTVPLFQLFSGSGTDHFYTTSVWERDRAIKDLNYTLEGIVAYVYPTPMPETVPLFRMYRGGAHNHFYTTTAPERDNACRHLGFVDEGIAAYVFPVTAVPLLQAWHQTIHDHFYTTDMSEWSNATKNLGYSSEDPAALVFTSQEPGTVPLYCLYHEAWHDHMYTTSESERDEAISSAGYRSKGIAAFIHATQVAGTVPLFCTYLASGHDHFYTTASSEADRTVHSSGYARKGVAGYVLWVARRGN